MDCYIGLGSNLASPFRQLADATAALDQLQDCRLVAVSPVYRSRAVGPGSQPDYLNAAARISTRLSANALLAQLQAIETRQGRVREERWGPRTLDLDLLLFGRQTIIDPPTLLVPHPRMAHRNFVLFPLLDLNPELTMPKGERIMHAALALGWRGLSRLQGPPLWQPAGALRHAAEQPSVD